MPPQAIRVSSPRRGPRARPPLRTYAALLGAFIFFLILGRLFLPLGILGAVLSGVMLWLAPEIAYWLDDALSLHTLPGFRGGHRQIAVACLAFLALPAFIGSMLLAGSGQAESRAARVEPTPLPTVDLAQNIRNGVPTSPPVPGVTLAFPTMPPEPTATLELELGAPPVRPSVQIVSKPAPKPTVIEPTLPPLRPTFTPAARPAGTAEGPQAAQKPAAPASKPTAAVPAPTAVPEVALEISGVTTVASAGGAVALQAKTRPGASCELVVQYPGGSSDKPGAIKAGDDGICAFTWTVPSNAQQGWANATVTARLGRANQSRQISFAVR